jgi:hypothetical protein
MMSAVDAHGAVSTLESLVERAMGHLARRRPLFHSEADFQLALAWELQTAHPHAQLRLEQRVMAHPPIALDILMRLDGRRYAFELKYLKRALKTVVDGEPYPLATGARRRALRRPQGHYPARAADRCRHRRCRLRVRAHQR